jgi:hypothetical protein
VLAERVDVGLLDLRRALRERDGELAERPFAG